MKGVALLFNACIICQWKRVLQKSMAGFILYRLPSKWNIYSLVPLVFACRFKRLSKDIRHYVG